MDYILQRIQDCYKNFFDFLLDGQGPLGKLLPAVFLLALAMVLLWLTGWLMDNRLSVGNKILLVAACYLLPAALNSGYLLFLMGNQSLLSYNRGFVGIFLLLCVSCRPAVLPARRYTAAAVTLAVVLLWQNVVFANQIYIKKELEKTSSVSLVTRMIGQIEEMDGYIPGETPVAFVGHLFDNALLSRGRDGYRYFTLEDEGALIYDLAPTYNLSTYITYYLNYPINIASIDASLDEIQAMPAFPYKGSIKWVDQTIVVKVA